MVIFYPNGHHYFYYFDIHHFDNFFAIKKTNLFYKIIILFSHRVHRKSLIVKNCWMLSRQACLIFLISFLWQDIQDIQDF